MLNPSMNELGKNIYNYSSNMATFIKPLCYQKQLFYLLNMKILPEAIFPMAKNAE